MHYLFLIIISFAILGCTPKNSSDVSHTKVSHHHTHHTTKKTHAITQDGEPSHPKFLDYIIPHFKSEPMSRYGNPDSYRVEGKTYVIMTNAKGYKKRGVASWYGTKFNKKRTSSGENYNMYKMTAAHRTLPIPSYIRVKNLSNGREAIVRVNDRGPFHSSRIVDLSYGAAHYLGLLPKGTALVEIEALIPKDKNATSSAHYYVQASAFSSKKLALALRLKLKHMTSSPIKIEYYNHRYLVIIGPFKNKQKTIVFKNTLARLGLNGSFTFLH